LSAFYFFDHHFLHYIVSTDLVDQVNALQRWDAQ
jgi:hypothetical protein